MVRKTTILSSSSDGMRFSLFYRSARAVTLYGLQHLS
ncbi:hypothetical protein EPYR_01647 [Erwinia pyrifoliae DSM 12163]|nr:hypothetical protein EPYR_01647 [Erwinia pyrifoliae DSM 12163]